MKATQREKDIYHEGTGLIQRAGRWVSDKPAHAAAALVVAAVVVLALILV